MSISDLGSYTPVMSEFAAHRGNVNVELGGGAASDLELQVSDTRTNCVADRAAIEVSITGLVCAPDSTPAAVTLSGAWNATTNQADLNWTPSSAATFANYEIGISPGST